MRAPPDERTTDWPEARRLPSVGREAPARVLERTLAGIEARYGERTGAVVAMQMEHPRSG